VGEGHEGGREDLQLPEGAVERRGVEAPEHPVDGDHDQEREKRPDQGETTMGSGSSKSRPTERLVPRAATTADQPPMIAWEDEAGIP